MRIEKSRHRIVCECGACRKLANYTVAFDRVGLSKSLHMCRECAISMLEVLNAALKDNQPSIKSDSVESMKGVTDNFNSECKIEQSNSAIGGKLENKKNSKQSVKSSRTRTCNSTKRA